MIIIRPSFSDYVKQAEELRLEENQHVLSEMPIPPTQFKNPRTGEFEGEYHVSSNNPVFMDENDILYLYQFPPEVWPQANAARYTKYLYEAKAQGKNYNNIQNIPIRYKNKIYIFNGRNTFAKELLDKIERTVDIHHFSNASKDATKASEYYKNFLKYGQEGKDLGGYLGANLSDPLEKEVIIGKDKKGETKKGKIWVTKGFIGPHFQSIANRTSKWIKASSEGWLGDPTEHGTVEVEGQNYLNDAAVAEVRKKLISSGATSPFAVISDKKSISPNVVYEDIDAETKDEAGKPKIIVARWKSKKGGIKLPLLLPGKAIESKIVNAHKQDEAFIKSVSSLSVEDLKDLQYAQKKIEEITKEIEEKDVKGWGDTPDRKKSRSPSRIALIKKLTMLQGMTRFYDWIKENKGSVDPNQIEEYKKEFTQNLKSQMRKRMNDAEKFDPYTWNVHRFSREREMQDPHGVGMEDPFSIGQLKHSKLRDKTTGFGTFWPNRQSKSMIHGPKGEWEDKFQNIISGEYNSEMEDFMAKHHLDPKDIEDIKKYTNTYRRKLTSKLISDPKMQELLDINPEDLKDEEKRKQIISSYASSIALKRQLKSKIPNLAFANTGGIKEEENRIPEFAKNIFNDIIKLDKKFASMKSDIEENVPVKSAVAKGIDAFLKYSRELAANPTLKSSMESSRLELIHGAERLIRRNIGDSPFVKYTKSLESGASGVEKHKNYLDMQDYVIRMAKMYGETIAQLDMGIIPTRRLRRGKKTISGDMALGDSDSGATFSKMASLEDHLKRIDQRTYEELENNPRIIQDLINSLFLNKEKSKVRWTRGASSGESQTIGHSIESMYSLLKEAQKDSEQRGIRALILRTEEEVSSEESKMLKNVSTAAAVFHLFKAMYKKNHGDSDGPEADNWAKDAMNKFLKSKKLISDAPMKPENWQDVANKIKNTPEENLDNAEKTAINIIQKWRDSDLDEEEIDDKLNSIYNANKNTSGPEADAQKRVIDIMFALRGKQPQFNTFAVAAQPNTAMIPDINLPPEVAQKMTGIAQNVLQNKPKRFPPIQPQATTNPTEPKAPDTQAGVTPNDTPLARMLKMKQQKQPPNV